MVPMILSPLAAQESSPIKVQGEVADKLASGNPASTKIGGQLGDRINACFNVRVLGQDVDHLIEPFNNKTETHRWQSEFLGKWLLGAILSYKNNQDPKLLEKIKHGAEGLIASQSPDGYIGNYAPEHQLKSWDVWGRKYSMLSLLSYYDLTGDEKALNSVRKLADYTLSQLGPDKTDIVKTGNYYGMASCSILEPMVFLYKRTGEQKYLDFCNYIVKQIESEDGAKLISKAGVDVADRFPHPVIVQKKGWWTPQNGQKAYEMMSCYEGLLEMYRLTGEKKYLEAVEKTAKNIIDTEINIAGSGASFECWYHGCNCQTHPAYHTMETCVTMTWMKLCQSLLAVTGDPKYADEIELTAYNALLASMKADASEIAKYSPLEGRRHPGEEQCGMKINCCNANGPRAFALLPQVAVMPMTDRDGLVVNLYTNLESEQTLKSGKKVKLRMTTNYPVDGKVKVEIERDSADTECQISFRRPAWCQNFVANFPKQIAGDKDKNQYFASVSLSDKKQAEWILDLDVRGRVEKRNGFVALMKGPVVLARDTRFNDGFIDDSAVVQVDKEGFVDLQPIENKPAGVWLAFTAPLVLGSDLEGEAKKPLRKAFCDFGSAGNTWDASIRYRVWLPETLNIQRTEYKPYNY